jgi:hypothetical protein
MDFMTNPYREILPDRKPGDSGRSRFGISAKSSHDALHYLTDLRALQSPARDMARDTRWRDKPIAEGWFAPEYRVGYRLRDF